ncbi:MAG: HsdM family class I SAM-dependent methyltransferase [Brevibacterium aurantiacum]|uniref:HsdM family class I SAM-dependent methyltransferase n=1 Tax=Brevibacterium aurantiacum TaxID=273384 RepID=UPI003F923AAF
MAMKKVPHPAISAVLQYSDLGLNSDMDRGPLGVEHTTSVSLARALAVGGLSRLDPSLKTVDIWDPAAGLGFAGYLLVDALKSAGVEVRYRGQDIDESSAVAAQHRFEAVRDAEVAREDTLAHDAFEDFSADLVIVDAPWGMDWKCSAEAVKARQSGGEFGFGVPNASDSTWLFISLALEKLRPTEQGGGRVAALVTPSALSSGGATGAVRERIVDAGLLESVSRLPDGLAPNTKIPLYLLTFSNRAEDIDKGQAMIADLQTMFTTEHRCRSIPVEAFHELERGLRTKKSGPRNRFISTRQFTRRDIKLSRTTSNGNQLFWWATTYNDLVIDSQFLETRFGPASGVSLVGEPRVTVDLDPSRIFGDDTRELIQDIAAKGWSVRRLSSFLTREPEVASDEVNRHADYHLFVPTTGGGRAATELSETNTCGRVLCVQLDNDAVYLPFLAAWLNSEQGLASRFRAIDNGSSGHHIKALRSDASSLMKWADELIVPVPDHSTQLSLASVDERLASFQAELSTLRASIWYAPDTADGVVSKIAVAFDDSLTAWLDQLPYPIASALWTAESAQTAVEKQRAYLHAWEAIVTFHATLLLSASRSDPGSSSETEAAIRETLQVHNLGIEKASFGTWVVIVEKTSKRLRSALENGDADDVARVRRAFADLGSVGIERLISKDIVKKFNEVNGKRNRWSGHTGYTSEQELLIQIESLVSDLRELRGHLGNVWSQLLLVRPGNAKLRREGLVQTAEVAMGTRTPFAAREFAVGELMVDDELYLVREGSQSPLRLGHFVQLRAAPSSAQFTTYFYNRTEGTNIRMVSYQYGPESELQDDVESLRADFGELARG